MEGVWGGEIVIRIYYMKKAYSKKEKMLWNTCLNRQRCVTIAYGAYVQ